MTQTTQFDPVKFKQSTREQWQNAAEPWHRWGPTLSAWLGPATETMLDMARVGPGDRVLDVAAGAGEQSVRAAKRVGPKGSVLATDISPKILDYARVAANDAGLSNVETRAVDGETLEGLEDGAFDVAFSRVGLIYFPDQQRALRETRRVLKPGGRVAAIVYSTPERNSFFSIPVGIVRRRANLPPPLPGQPGPFSLGGEGVLAAAFHKAGFRDVGTRTVSAPLRLPRAADHVRFARESFGALHEMMSSLTEREKEDTWREIETALRKYEGPNGFEGECELLVGVGVK